VIQVWDCAQAIEVAKTHDYEDETKTKADFIKTSEPFKQYEFEVNGNKP
jgi:hypothetical protein